MPAQQQQGQGQADNSYALLWIFAAVFISAGLIWYFFHTQIVTFVFWIKSYEALFLSVVVAQMDQVVATLHMINPAEVAVRNLYQVSEYIGFYFAFPAAVIMLVMSYFLYQKDITARYRRIYNMKSFLTHEQVNWPSVVPVAKLDLGNTDIYEGPWAMALTPLQFAKKYRLLKKDLMNQHSHRSLQAVEKFPKYLVNKGEAKRVFTMQLGAYWEGPDKLPPHTKALFAVFAARICQNRKPAVALLEQISSSFAEGHLDFSGSDELLRKHFHDERVTEAYQGHAYVLTMMASMLKAARLDGVLPAADFLWLKPVDRTLWYMLNTVGRQTPFVEVAGPFAHWKAELKLGGRVLVPMVDEAANGLEIAIREFKFKKGDIKDEDLSS